MTEGCARNQLNLLLKHQQVGVKLKEARSRKRIRKCKVSYKKHNENEWNKWIHACFHREIITGNCLQTSYLLAFDWWICQIRNVLFVSPGYIQIWALWKTNGSHCIPESGISRATAAFSSWLLQRGWEKVAAAALRSGCTWCWGGKKEGGGGRHGGRKGVPRGEEGRQEKKVKGTFFSLVTKAVHTWVGPDRAI